MEMMNVKMTDMHLEPAETCGEESTMTHAAAHVTKHNTVTNLVTERVHSTSKHNISLHKGCCMLL